MKTIYIIIIFIIVAVIQLFIPAQMILNQEFILKNGTAYKFKTQPIDPNDPFRGKYINLNFEKNTIKTKDSTWKRNEPIYVYLTTDRLGYVEVESVSRKLLTSKNDYIEAKVAWYTKNSNNLSIRYPFTKYYMEETKAYDAEVAVRNRQQDSIPNNTYALVYVKDGASVLSDVIIDDISIQDYVELER